MKCWDCPYIKKGLDCNLSKDTLHVAYNVLRKHPNLECPFISEKHKMNIDYDKYIDDDIADWINEYENQKSN